MELLSNTINKVKSEVLFEKNNFKLLDVQGTTAFQQKDMVICIPYLSERNIILMRYENVAPFELIRPEISKYITAMSTAIDTTPEEALKKGLEENFGIVLDEKKKFEILQPIFIDKHNTARYHICILPLMSYDYEQVRKNEVVAMEMKDNNVLINSNELNNYIVYDLISRYSVDLFKKEFSLF